mgnify:CR=1 FL=1
MKTNRTNAITQQRLIDASRAGRKLFRNHVGTAYQGKTTQINTAAQMYAVGKRIASKQKINCVLVENPRFCKFGLHTGSGDLIGWAEKTITPDMVGQKIAVFASEEIKSKNDRMSKEQKAWHFAVKLAGGISNIVKEQPDGSIELQ